jgi:hypothetical protein
MATLYIPGLNVGLPVWLGTIPNVPNALDASQLSTLSHGHPVDVSSSAKSSPPPSPPLVKVQLLVTESLNEIERGRIGRRNHQPL